MKRYTAMVCRLVLAAAATIGAPRIARAQTTDFGILDNSFLVEEAFNQDRGFVQNIFTWTRSETGEWVGSFTQEWPVPGIVHQLSYSVPFAGGDGTSAHAGAILVNYRYQLLNEAPGRPAFAPRMSLILPSGRSVDNSDRTGLQVNLPFSKEVHGVYLHGNGGLTWLHGVPSGSGDRISLTTPQLEGSVVWNTRPLLNLMLESTLAFEDKVRTDNRASREPLLTVSPGFRGGWNLQKKKQIIVGAALPVTVGEGERMVALLTYFSCELPFTAKARDEK